MINFQCLKILFNPLNAIITGIIVLFICSRVLSNNHENAFIIEEITTIESQIKQPTEQPTVLQTVLQTEQQTEQKTEQPTVRTVPNDETKSPSEALAYSAELDKTFTIDAFNKLSKEELMTFTGIGEVTAQAILDYRRDNGPFGHFEDLMLVKGIGEKKLQKIMTILP